MLWWFSDTCIICSIMSFCITIFYRPWPSSSFAYVRTFSYSHVGGKAKQLWCSTWEMRHFTFVKVKDFCQFLVGISGTIKPCFSLHWQRSYDTTHAKGFNAGDRLGVGQQLSKWNSDNQPKACQSLGCWRRWRLLHSATFPARASGQRSIAQVERCGQLQCEIDWRWSS